MPRRARPTERAQVGDRKFANITVQQFINKVMRDGKRATAEGIVYNAVERAEQATRKPAVEVFETAMKNATPLLEVKPRRVGGATYQVPIEIRPERRLALARRWLIRFARQRSGKSMAEKLAFELLDASNGVGAAVKRKEETHRMAESNKAFSHFRY